jgi:Type II secretion system (T2SS), protein N
VRRGFLITLLAVVVFAVIVIARLPASWVVPDSSSEAACAAVDGSIWNGTCTGLTAQRSAVGDVTWKVHPLRLLKGKLCAKVTLTRATGSVRGDFEIGLDKSITAYNVQAAFPLDREVMSLLPPNMRTLQGTANADIAFAHVVKNIVTQIQGRIEVHDLEDHDRDAVMRLGSYSVTFPGGSGVPTGQLRDLGGPLGVDMAVRLTQDKPGFDVEGYVTPRADAPPAIVSQLQFLPVDAQGRREFGTSVTF